MHDIEPGVWAWEVAGRNLDPGRLQRQLSPDATVLVFLRHLGCLFSTEMVKDLRQATLRDASYPPVLFFHLGTIAQGEQFFAPLWPEARAVADPDRRFYEAFGVKQGSVGQMFGPATVACGIRATLKGNFARKPIGDPWTMPGLFLVRGTEVVWQHPFANAGDHPDFALLAQRARPVGAHDERPVRVTA